MRLTTNLFPCQMRASPPFWVSIVLVIVIIMHMDMNVIVNTLPSSATQIVSKGQRSRCCSFLDALFSSNVKGSKVWTLQLFSSPTTTLRETDVCILEWQRHPLYNGCSCSPVQTSACTHDVTCNGSIDSAKSLCVSCI